MSESGPYVAHRSALLLEKLIGPPPSGIGDRAINAQ